MQFRILGPLEVQSAHGIVRIGSRLQRRLLAALLVNARAVVSADRLVDIVWGGQAPADPRQNLWTCVARLRRTLAEKSGTAVGELLVTRPPGYLLAAEPEQIDAGQFERLVRAAARTAADEPRVAGDILDRALGLWRGPALPEFAAEPFAAAEAARLDELRLTAIEDRFEIDLVLGEHSTLIGQLSGFITAQPLRDRCRAQLMLALYRCGRHAEALQVYRTYREILDSELGLEPSTALRSLQTQILAQDVELDWHSPVAAVAQPGGAAAPGSRLPPELTSFVGRADDLAAAVATVADARLVTLTGVGGVGKTRLALRTAALAGQGFVDGVAWCELAPVTDPAAVAAAVASSLGVRRDAGATVVESIVAALSDQQRLLVLDNCEHLLDGVRPLVAEVIHGCPRVAVLATSRERLAVDGEQVRPVAPLPVPVATRPPAATDPAISLFVDRARAVRPDLRLDENLAPIADICRQLDGLPLALELAAARARSLNPADISDRLRSSLDLLSPAGAPAGRHSTLRAVLDWSYELLGSTRRQLFDRLSVFAGAFDLAAAEAVAAGGGIQQHQVVDLLTSLADASMVTVGAGDGTVRYALLETLRHYGAEHLGDGPEAQTVHRVHALHYTSVAEKADRGLRGPEESGWVSIVDRDLDNLRAAHRWIVQAGQTDLALRLSCGLRYYMLFRFRDEVVGWGAASLALPGAEQHALFAAACGAVGEGMTARGEMDAALALADRALARITDVDDERRMYALRVAGMVALYVGRLDDAFVQHAEMLRLAQLHHHPYEEGMALLGLAQSRTYAGEPGRGLAYAEEQLAVVRPLGNPSMLALAWYDQAEALSGVDASRAIESYRRAARLAESAGSTFVEGITLVGLASSLGRSQEPGVALPLFRSIIGRWRRMGIWQHQWTTLRNLVQVFVRSGDWESAAVLLGAIDAGSTAAPAFGSDADLTQAAADRLADELGPSMWSAAHDRGAAMSSEQAVAFACEAIDRHS